MRNEMRIYLWTEGVSIIRLIMKHIFVVYLFGVKNIVNMLYKFCQTCDCLTSNNMLYKFCKTSDDLT